MFLMGRFFHRINDNSKRKMKILLILSNSVTCMSIFLSIDFVDKRGSKVKKTSKEDLHKFYEISDESDKGIANNASKTLIIS